MARVSMTASVSLARAMLILSACLIFGMLVGLMPHNSSQSLRTTGGQEKTPETLLPKIPDVSLFSRSVRSAHNKEEAVNNGYVWNGKFAAIQHQILDTEFSLSYDFEGSYSYYYDY